MTKEDIQLLYEYDRWANERVLTASDRLAAEQFTRDLGGSFRSVRDTFVHILAGEWIWLTYWQAKSPSVDFLSGVRKQRDVLFDPQHFPDVSAVRMKWKEIEKEQTGFVSSLSAESLEQILPYRDTRLSLMHLMQHVANHSTYHRGQIALMMRQLKAEPLATDFHVFLADRNSINRR
jgi:uncharacterized damage-inducible protein DinB